MTAKQITEHEADIAELINQIAAHSTDIATAIALVAASAGVTLRFDSKLVLEDLGAIAKAKASQAMAAEATVAGDVQASTTSSSSRTAAGKGMKAGLVSARSTLEAQYGVPQVATLFTSATPGELEVQALSAFATKVIANLATAVAGWKELPTAMNQVNVTRVVDNLTTLKAALDVANHDAGDGHARRSSDQAKRALAEKQEHDLRTGLRHMVIGLMYSAGRDDLAKLLVKHHAPPTPPVPAPAP